MDRAFGATLSDADLLVLDLGDLPDEALGPIALALQADGHGLTPDDLFAAAAGGPSPTNTWLVSLLGGDAASAARCRRWLRPAEVILQVRRSSLRTIAFDATSR